MYLSKITVINRANAVLDVVGTSSVLDKVIKTLSVVSNNDQRTIWCCDIAITKILVDNYALLGEIDDLLVMQRMLDEQTKSFDSFYTPTAHFNVSDFNCW